MMKVHHRFLLPCLFVALASTAAAAQTPAPKAAETPKAEEFVTDKSFKSRVFQVRHRDPVDLSMVLRPLGSGFKGSTLVPSRDLSTISVRDYPENIATIEEALKRLDVPEPPARDVDLRIHVIVASRGEGGGGPFPAELKPVVEALRGTLNYKSYRLMTTLSQRAKDRSRGLQGGGVAALDEATETKERPYSVQMEYRINSLEVASTGTGPSAIRLDGFQFKGWGVFGYEGRVDLATELTVKDGEQVVVGTSVIKDKGVILVVSCKLLK